jgi:Uma2 family endonuclease
MAIPKRRLTLEEFLKLPEEKPALEYIDGVVTQKVSPQKIHGRLQLKVAERLNAFAEPRKLALTFVETRDVFSGSSPVPDVSVYRWDRVPRDARGRLTNDHVGPPDIAVEIVSPEQSVADLITRCRWYVEHGVSIALLVEPEDEWIRLFRPETEEEELRGADRINLDSVLSGFELTAQELFDSLYAR